MLLSQIKKCLQFHGSLENPYSVGTNKLIKNGAYLITSGMDIIKDFSEFSNRKKRNFVDLKIKKEYVEIYKCLSNNFTNIDEISLKSGYPIRDVISILTLMEIDGIVSFELGKGYFKKKCIY